MEPGWGAVVTEGSAGAWGGFAGAGRAGVGGGGGRRGGMGRRRVARMGKCTGGRAGVGGRAWGGIDVLS
jgi:hypothetical protein